jgi:hypothetical protein
MRNLLAVLILLAAPVWAQSPVYESQPDDAAVDMTGDFTPPYESNLMAVYNFNDPDDLGRDGAFNVRAESATFSAGDSVSVADSEAFNHKFGKGLSACIWIDDVGNDQTILFKGGFIDAELNFYTGTNVIGVQYASGIVGDTETSVTVAFTPGAKTFLCGYFFDPTRKARISVNGGSYISDTGDMDYDAPNSGADFQIGANALGADLVGIVDQIVTFVDGEPPASDLYNAGAGRSCEWIEANTTATTCYSMDLSTWGLTDSIFGTVGTATGTLEASDPLVVYGNAYDLTPVNTPTPTGGAKGLAMEVASASTQYAYIDGEPESLHPGSSDYLYCQWVRPAGVAGNELDIAILETSGGTPILQAYNATTQLNVESWSDTGAASVATIATGVSAGGRSLYCMGTDISEKKALASNGVTTNYGSAWASGTEHRAYGNSTGGLYVGRRGATYGDAIHSAGVVWKGTELDFDTLIAGFYNSGKGKTCGELTSAEKVNLVECWDMDDDPATTWYVGSNNAFVTSTYPSSWYSWAETSDSFGPSDDVTITSTNNSTTYQMFGLTDATVTATESDQYAKLNYAAYCYPDTTRVIWYRLGSVEAQTTGVNCDGSGDVLKLEKTGTTVKGYLNDVLKVTFADEATGTYKIGFSSAIQGEVSSPLTINGVEPAWTNLLGMAVGHALSGVNTPTQAAGLVEQPTSGMGVDLDGTSQYFSLASPGLGFTNGPFTICAWINTETVGAGNAHIVSHYDGGVGAYLYRATATLAFITRRPTEAAVVATGGVLNANTWHHVCGVSTATSTTAYLDGVAGTPQSATGVVGSVTAETTVGAYSSPAQWFQGPIDEVKIWSRDIGPLGVAEDYAAGEGKFW